LTAQRGQAEKARLGQSADVVPETSATGFGPNGLSRGCKVFCSKSKQIVLHEADEPNAVVDFLDAEPLYFSQ
jgi:hypothetical protein